MIKKESSVIFISRVFLDLQQIMREGFDFCLSCIVYSRRMIKSAYVIKNRTIEVILLWDVIANMWKYCSLIRFIRENLWKIALLFMEHFSLIPVCQNWIFKYLANHFFPIFLLENLFQISKSFINNAYRIRANIDQP